MDVMGLYVPGTNSQNEDIESLKEAQVFMWDKFVSQMSRVPHLKEGGCGVSCK